MKSFFLLFQPQAMFHFLLKPTCRFLLNLPFISHFEPRLTVTQREMKKKTKTNKQKNQAAQDKKPNEASGRKITQDALQSPHTTAKCHFTQSFTADTKPTRSTMVPYCKGRKGACYCEKKTTCNIYLCYIILMCRRRSLHFWYQQRKTLSFCRSH